MKTQKNFQVFAIGTGRIPALDSDSLYEACANITGKAGHCVIRRRNHKTVAFWSAWEKRVASTRNAYPNERTVVGDLCF